MSKLTTALLLLAPLYFSLTGCSRMENIAAIYPDPMRFEQDIVRFEKSDQKAIPSTGAIVCVGSSSMYHWHDTIRQDLAPLTVIPRGFGGSTYYDLLYYLDRVVLKYQPRAVMIYEGDNDIAEGVPPQDILWTFRQVVRRIHKTLPESSIYVLSIKPSGSRWHLWPQTQEANRLLKADCEKDSLLTYIDVATPLLGETGKPNEELFLKDKLHLNHAGYEVWTSVVRPILIKGEHGYEK